MQRGTWLAAAGLLAVGLAGCGGTRALPRPEVNLVPDGVPPTRASWVSDRMALRTGDVVTVILDEQTSARERVTDQATSRRDLSAGFSFNADGTGKAADVGSGLDANSRQVGEAQRQGDLAGVVTAMVLGIDTSGLAVIEGRKSVVIDGRTQEVSVWGLVRPQDIAPGNVVYSSRLVYPEIVYRGNDIKPKLGLLGKVASALWP